MKKLSLSIILGILILGTYAQNNYEKAIKDALNAFYTSQTLEEMNSTAGTFERIAEAEPRKWLPRYYAAYVYTIHSYKVQESDKKQQLIDAAQKQLDVALEIAPKESEVHVLQGMIYQATIMVDPAAYGQSYSTKAASSFNTAMNFNPANPRPVYLQAMSVLSTPEQYGGGKDAAQPIFERAVKMFDSFTPENEIMPNWGKEHCLQQMKIYVEK